MLGLGRQLGQRYLVRAEGAFDLQAVDYLWGRSSLWA